MQREKLSLKHKESLQARLKNNGTFLSEYSFANLYLFRNAHDYQVVTETAEIFIAGHTYDGLRYVMPTVDIRKSHLGNLLRLGAEYDFIFPVPEEWLTAFAEKKIKAEFSEGDSDYIYTVEKLSTYKGQKLHSKKNLLNQFLSLYSPKTQPLTKERMVDALNILDVWQEDVGETKAATDYDACREAFELYDALILCGGIYYVNEEPVGFIIGEELNEKMFALHFAKGKRKFKGMYQYMYNHFANILPKKYVYLNFEQDLGKLALKIAKASYHPDQMLKKFRVKILNNSPGAL